MEPDFTLMMSPVSTLGQNEPFWVRHLPSAAPLQLQTCLSHVIMCLLLCALQEQCLARPHSCRIENE